MEEKLSELIDSVKETLTIVIDNSSDIANDFQKGNTGMANGKMGNYIENLIHLIKEIAILQDKKLGMNLQTAALRDVLAEMEQIMINQDYVLLADFLEYEIKEVLIGMQSNLVS